MIEYKTRRRASNPKVGDGVWVEGKVEGKPMAIGMNGKIVRIDWQEREVMVLFEGRQLTYEFDDIRDCWNDVLNIYILEEPYVETTEFNNHDGGNE